MKSAVVRAGAKINLSLDIIEKLENGYHSLFMIMQSLDLYDTVTVTQREGTEIRVSCSDGTLPHNEKNIAYKAAVKFFEHAKTDVSGLDIRIEKRIPVAAGLAGGSADAAAVIVALNDIFHMRYSEREMCSIGIKVGADVPFCIVGGTSLAQDIGGVLSPLPDIPDCTVVLAKPPVGVSTKDAYEAFDGAWWIRHPKNLQVLNAAVRGELTEIASLCENVFEQVLDTPKRVDIKFIMREYNALTACMSGTGPTVFGIFESSKDACACEKALRAVVPDVFVCKPTRKNIIIE